MQKRAHGVLWATGVPLSLSETAGGGSVVCRRRTSSQIAPAGDVPRTVTTVHSVDCGDGPISDSSHSELRIKFVAVPWRTNGPS